MYKCWKFNISRIIGTKESYLFSVECHFVGTKYTISSLLKIRNFQRNKRLKINLLFHRSSPRCTLLNGQLNIADRRGENINTRDPNQRRFNPLDYNSSGRACTFSIEFLRFSVKRHSKGKSKGRKAADQNNLFCTKYKNHLVHVERHCVVKATFNRCIIFTSVARNILTWNAIVTTGLNQIYTSLSLI